jgi:S1-C subfamily serine protease
MDINELNKKQLVLLTLLITFVVSIGTGIVTVSLMKQVPPTVPQTINNVIQRTIEKVTTVEQIKDHNNESKNSFNIDSGNQLVSIFKKTETATTEDGLSLGSEKEIGQGVIISDEGLVLVNSNTVEAKEKYEVYLDEKMYGVYVLKNFDNGFTILKIGEEKIPDVLEEEKDEIENQYAE